MSFVPTLCDQCFRARLVGLREFREQAPRCARCDQLLRVVPSATYAIGDLELFDELSETIADSIAASEAQHWGAVVDRALQSGAFSKTFDGLVARWASLTALRTVVGVNRAQQQRILRMFKTIFDALALTRTSGSVPVVQAAVVVKQRSR